MKYKFKISPSNHTEHKIHVTKGNRNSSFICERYIKISFGKCLCVIL